MKIYYTNSTAEFKKYKDRYYKIREIIINSGHVLTRDWLARTEKRLGTYQITSEDIQVVYKDCIKALREADIVIIEDTVSNFSTGHQITIALEMQKPTLVLWNGPKHKYFKKMFIHGIESDLLEVKQYTMDNLEDIIISFIEKYEGYGLKNRFHLVLTNMERRYLDWAPFNKGLSRTNIIKKCINKEIKKDKEYKNYLLNKNR